MAPSDRSHSNGVKSKTGFKDMDVFKQSHNVDNRNTSVKSKHEINVDRNDNSIKPRDDFNKVHYLRARNEANRDKTKSYAVLVGWVGQNKARL
ncbi:hypothetical protein J6590_039870 [Homalodisca vitripennis]|nr:hypothetical protein J6590_039870 [Homalodisca vitripennis]